MKTIFVKVSVNHTADSVLFVIFAARNSSQAIFKTDFMKDLSISLLLAELEILISAYKETEINLVHGTTSSIADDRGADLLRLLSLVAFELVDRIELSL